MGNIFNRTGNIKPGKSAFDLSYDKKFSTDMGLLIPVMCDEVVPGDVFKMGNEIVLRFQPLIAPILHEVNIYVHYFYVPYRILWDEWEDFITGGPEGDLTPTLPTWEPTNTDIGSLWDFLGFPTGVDPAGAYPIDFPRSSYNKIWNDYYRDENLQTEIDLDGQIIKRRAWEKDYFTSALPWQQRGTAPALPISGTSSAVWSGPNSFNQFAMLGDSAGQIPYNQNTHDLLENNTVDLSSATTFNVSDLRLAFQVQRWLERNARAGARYTEFLFAHFGVSPRDERLQRPEYIGGTKSSIVISEVLQTSETDVSPQGNLAGHGVSANRNLVGSYRAKEYGLIMGILSVMPRTAYQQGINRQWLRRTKYDFFFPEFANLSEQAIETAEIFATDVDTENETIFGYQGRYDEMRVKSSMVCSQMRTTFDYWALTRIFASAPLLNESFIECNPSKRIFAVQDEDTLIINFANKIKAIRPMPVMANPGLIDH